MLHAVPIIIQNERSECGLACIGMILNAFGKKISLAELRGKYSISLKGTSLSNLIKIAQDQGLQCRALRVEIEELSKLATPCILHWGLDHFVVLTNAKPGRIFVNDPARGRRELRVAEVSLHFTGVVLELKQTVKFERKIELPVVSFKQITGSIWGLRRSLIQIILLSLALQAFTLIAPLLSQLVTDQVILSQDYNLLTVVVIGFGILTVVQMAIGLLRQWAGIVLSSQLSLQWNANVLAHVLKLPKDFFEKRHLGDLTSRMGSVNAIQGFITSTAVGIILDGLMAVSTLLVMLRYNSMLFLVSQCALLIYFLLRLSTYRFFREANEEQLVLSAKQNSFFLEMLRGITSIKVAGNENIRHATWLNLASDTQNQSIRIAKMGMWFGTASGLIFGVEKILIMYFGAVLVMDHVFSLGMLMAFLAYNDQFSSRISGLVDTLINFKMLRLHTERLSDVVLSEPEAGYDLPEVLLPGSLDIEVAGLGFRYADSEPWILRDANFIIKNGESVAIVGRSGSGKTTLAKLLVGLTIPTEGVIKIGGFDINKYGPRNFRRVIGVVMQDDQLFAGTISENISFFDADADQAEIERVARLAAIHDEIQAMPMSYHSPIGDMGSSLSGGQKQRVILARALYRKPRILLLDEATSHLDMQNEHLVNAAVKQLAVTKVIVAHRPETIASADRVLVIHGGKVVQEIRPPKDAAAQQPVSAHTDEPAQ